VTVRWDPIDPTPASAKAFSSMHDSMNGGWGGSLEELAGHLKAMTWADAQKAAPYLTITDAAKAIDYYKRVFGAKEGMRMMAEDGMRIMHCALRINDGAVLLSGEFAEHGGPAGPKPGSKSPVAVALELKAPAEVDRIYKAAIGSGSTSGMAPADMFWGGRFADFTDPFGHRWMLNAANPKA